MYQCGFDTIFQDHSLTFHSSTVALILCGNLEGEFLEGRLVVEELVALSTRMITIFSAF